MSDKIRKRRLRMGLPPPAKARVRPSRPGRGGERDQDAAGAQGAHLAQTIGVCHMTYRQASRVG
ncbi:hypothetical protein ABT234_23670 [Streptomyces sp. NPDC001586]|uniref:hypothetical protein n=1 Tax=Streptomyces sp. NPDC001586 TaxID=3154387 RepID=UPI00331A7C8B